VSIGIAKIEVKLYISCSEVPGSGLHQGCPECLSQVLAPRTCETHGVLDSLVKVYRDGDTIFQITEDDFTSMKLETKKNFVSVALAKTSDVADLLTESFKKYYLVPDGFSSITLYAALAEALEKNKQVLMGKYSLNSGRENLAAILPDDAGGLILVHLPFQDIRRPRPELNLPVVTPAIQKGMKVILSILPTTFDYDAATDNYDAALQRVILAKTTAQITKASETIKQLATVTKITEANGVKTGKPRRKVLDGIQKSKRK
jgi:non-homologous end joining protein Ku